jgi:hypothetical protein
MERKSKAYQFSLTADDLGSPKLAELKAHIKAFNKMNLSHYMYGHERPNTYRVCVKARLGKGNPNAPKYYRRGVFTVAKADAIANQYGQFVINALGATQ